MRNLDPEALKLLPGKVLVRKVPESRYVGDLEIVKTSPEIKSLYHGKLLNAGTSALKVLWHDYGVKTGVQVVYREPNESSQFKFEDAAYAIVDTDDIIMAEVSCEEEKTTSPA